MKLTSKKVIGEIKRSLSVELLIGIISAVIIWIATVNIWYGIYVIKIIGQMDAERTSGTFKIAGKMLRDAPFTFIIVTAVSIFLGYLIAVLIKRRKKLPDKRGDIIVPTSRRRPMDNEELQSIFTLRDDDDLEGFILGRDEETGLLITLPDEVKDYNKAPTNNMVIGFGPSGTRKTSGIILPAIYQYIMQGRPMCVTDPKGEIYRDTVAAAKYYGYKVYLFNIITNQSDHSDGVDILKPIREASDEEANALIMEMINLILSNTGSEGSQEQFWVDSAKNFLYLVLALVTRVASFKSTYNVHIGSTSVQKTFPVNSAGEYRTFSTVYELLKMPDNDLVDLINQIIDEKDLEIIRGPFNNWDGNSQAKQVKVSLSTQLFIFNNPMLCKILSEPDIDLDRIVKEKAIIYLECPDGPSPQACVLSMFITTLLHKLEAYVDIERNGRGFDIPYSMIFEEFANIGRLPEGLVSRALATFRSRNIQIMMFLQSLSQLKSLYTSSKGGKDEWESILSNCAIQLLLGAGDITTAEYFEERSGMMTVVDQSQRRTRNLFTRILSSAEETQTIRQIEKPVYSASELLGDKFPVNKILIQVGEHNALMAEKYFSKLHPLYRIRFEAEDGGVLDMSPLMHMPAWRLKELSDERRKVTGKGYIPDAAPLKLKYFENYDIVEDDHGEVEEKKSLKEIIEHILFEDEPKVTRTRVKSTRSFSALMPEEEKRENVIEKQNEEPEAPVSGEEETDGTYDEDPFEDAFSSIGMDDRDKIASKVFDDYDW